MIVYNLIIKQHASVHANFFFRIGKAIYCKMGFFPTFFLILKRQCRGMPWQPEQKEYTIKRDNSKKI